MAVARHDMHIAADLAKRVKEHLLLGARLAEKVLVANVKHYANLTDHSLEALAKMGYPYAKRDPRPPHRKSFVHKQSGLLLKNIESRVVDSGDVISVMCYVNPAKVPYIGSVVDGTTKMIPRPFFDEAYSFCEPKLKQIIVNGIHRAAGSRSGVVGRPE